MDAKAQSRVALPPDAGPQATVQAILEYQPQVSDLDLETLTQKHGSETVTGFAPEIFAILSAFFQHGRAFFTEQSPNFHHHFFFPEQKKDAVHAEKEECGN